MAGAVLAFNVAAIKAVMVVPTLAPMMKGAACLRFAIFLATMGTTTDVVIVLERIAAIVSNPHKKDLNWFLKKKRPNCSGDRAFSRLEISLRKIRMDENKRTSATNARKNGLGTSRIKNSMTGLKPTQ